MSVYDLSGEFMRSVIAASVLLFVCIFAAPAIAQHEEVGVPIVKAPYHLPVFTNEYVTVLKIDITPGRNTGYHTHTEDSVSVNIVPADMTKQNLGSSEVTRGERAQRGRANYTSYSKGGPRTHKATNVGSTSFHNVSFLFRNRPGRFTPSARTEAPGYLQIMDNERVRGWCWNQASRLLRFLRRHPAFESSWMEESLPKVSLDRRTADGRSAAGNSIGRRPELRALSAISAQRALRSWNSS